LSLLRNNSFILALAVAGGIAAGHVASFTRSLVTPLLAVIMTLSLVGVSSDVFRGGTRLRRTVALALLLNYGILGGAFVLLSMLLLDDPALRAGFVLIAAVPPAVAVIPFTYRLGGNLSFTLIGSVAGHVAAFVLTPLITLMVLGGSLVQPAQLLTTLLQLVAVPFLMSRLLRRCVCAVTWLNAHRGTLINWGFFLVVYTIIGLNRTAFFSFSIDLMRIAVVSGVCTFGMAHAIYAVSRWGGSQPAQRVSYAVFGAWKNYGLAGAIALLYFGEAAALPAAATTAFAIVNFIILNATIAVKQSASQ